MSPCGSQPLRRTGVRRAKSQPPTAPVSTMLYRPSDVRVAAIKVGMGSSVLITQKATHKALPPARAKISPRNGESIRAKTPASKNANKKAGKTSTAKIGLKWSRSCCVEDQRTAHSISTPIDPNAARLNWVCTTLPKAVVLPTATIKLSVRRSFPTVCIVL